MFWIPYVLFAVIVSAVIAGVWWLRRRWSPAAGAGAGVTPDFEQLVLSQLANRLPLAAMRSLLKSQPAPRTSGVCLFTADDARRLRQTIGELYHPSDELFPLLKQPLPVECLYLVESCPTLVHPTTGVVFGMRIGTYLCLLRLPDEARERALADGAAWVKHPLVSKLQVDLAALLGPEWTMPNSAHPQIAEYYGTAFAAAAAGQ